MKKRFLSMLVLLAAVVTGAWAQTETLLTTITATGTEQASYSTANVATVSFSYLPNCNSVYSDNWGWWGYGFTATVTAAEGYTITKCVFYDNDGASATDSTDPFIVETEEQNKKPKVNGATFGAFTSAGIKMIEVYGFAPTPNSIVISGTPQVGDKSISLTYHFNPNNVTGLDDGYAPTLKVKCAADNKWDETSLSSTEVSSGTTSISLSNLGEFEAGKTYEVCFAYNNGNWVDEVFQSFVPAEPPIKVTTNKAEGETTFTEASFAMPAFDATAEYELVRDMSIQMTATMGDGTQEQPRYRVKKSEQNPGKYEPADLNMLQVLALVDVYDGIEQKTLTLNEDYYCRIYKLDEQTLQPEGDGVMLYDFDFAPGLYALKAFATVGSDYAGETALSNTFKLFQGYEITVPAGEFVTYYKDEPLRIEDQEADLYTIQSLSADQAVLSSPSDAMPALTPMLIYNKSQQEKVILLIPCAEPDLDITVAPEFQGTLTGTTIAASTENQTNYAFNGKAFVFVKNDLPIGANKAWLSVNTGVPSARITLVFDEATGVNGVIGVKEVNDGSWYDLNGRKLNGMPTKKGVYLFNGRKVVVK